MQTVDEVVFESRKFFYMCNLLRSNTEKPCYKKINITVSWPRYLRSILSCENIMNDVMLTYMKWFVDQRFNLLHFDTEQFLSEHAEIDTMRFIGQLDRCVCIYDKQNI